MRSESTRALGQPSETKPTFGLLVALAFVALLASGETGEGKAREHIAGLVLHLILELLEHLLALLHVRLHQALHRGALQVHELRPELLRGTRVVAVLLLRLILNSFLDFLKRYVVVIEVLSHLYLHHISDG